MYAVLGATGNTGSVVANSLLAKGEKLRVIGRDPGRLAPLVQKGAESFLADVTDSAALARAFTGARAVYAMIPPNLAHPDLRSFEERVSDAIASALGQAGVSYAVTLSSVGADKSDKTGPVVGLHNLEQKLNAIPKLNVLHLRAGYFMENLLPQVGVIQSFGVVGGPLPPNLALPMIAAKDIGVAAAAALLKLDFTGKETRELLGQRDVTYAEVTRVIGNAIGKPDLSYVQMPPEQVKPAFMQLGMSANVADLLLEMCEALISGHMAPLEPRSPRNTTPTSIETFVQEVFLPAYRGKAAGA